MSEQSISSETSDFTWTVRLYEKDPGKRLIVFLIAVGAALAGLLLFQNVIFAALALAAVLASTAEFWLPLHYKLDEKGASVRCFFSVTAIEWAHVRRVVADEGGLKLSPHRSEGRTSPFRGVFLRFGQELRAVRDYVRNHVDENVRFVELGTDPRGGGGASSEGGQGDQEAQNAGAGDPGAGGS